MEYKKIALTGGIGSGKSTALKILSESGYKTLSSDNIVSELYNTPHVKRLLKKLFPTAVKGFFRLSVDRKAISKIVFNDHAAHKKLTDAITPLVLKKILKRTKVLTEHVFVEVPLLFECGYQEYFDKVLVITRSLDDRIESVKQRSSLTKEEILSRIKAQTDYDSFDLSPYHVIINDGDVTALKDKVLDFTKTLNQKQ